MSDPAEPDPEAAAPPPAPSAPDAESGQKTAAAGPPMLLEVQEEYVPCLFRYVTAIARISGVITVIVLWVITGNMIGSDDSMGTREWYMIALSVVFTIFESLWMINKCASKIKNEGCICACWHVCIWFDNWKKTILYVGITIPCLVDPIVNVQTIIAAILVLVTSVFYFLRSFKDSGCVKRKTTKSMNYVETGSTQARLVNHEVQTDGDYQATANGTNPSSPDQKYVVSETK